jgi:hypothetical protein
MDLFAISDLQRFSGIKSHTIRIWEQRYNTLKPERSEGNTRYYSGNQLRRLLNIVSLQQAGYKIAELSPLKDKQLYELIGGIHPENIGQQEMYQYFITQMIHAGLEFNEAHFEKMFSASLLRYGLNDTYNHVVYPMLVRIGIMWSTDTIPPAQEHFISNLIRQKLLAVIDTLPPAGNSADPWLLFLPEDEFHEIGLLFAGLLIRLAGKKVIYLGAGTSFETLQVAVTATRPAHLLFFMTHHDDPDLTRSYIRKLARVFPYTDLNIAGNTKLIETLAKEKKLTWIKSSDDLEQKLNNTVV